MTYQVYTYFGRVLAQFQTLDNETHHNAASKAREYLLEQENMGTTCWIRLNY